MTTANFKVLEGSFDVDTIHFLHDRDGKVLSVPPLQRQDIPPALFFTKLQPSGPSNLVINSRHLGWPGFITRFADVIMSELCGK